MTLPGWFAASEMAIGPEKDSPNKISGPSAGRLASAKRSSTEYPAGGADGYRTTST